LESPSTRTSFASVSVGNMYICGVKTDGTIACWGDTYGAPDTPPPAGTFTSVSVGYRFACGVKTDGTIACWDVPQAPVNCCF
jgi:alpha-tubulin suppressor-like RCC1 family protein